MIRLLAFLLWPRNMLKIDSLFGQHLLCFGYPVFRGVVLLYHQSCWLISYGDEFNSHVSETGSFKLRTFNHHRQLNIFGLITKLEHGNP